MHKTSSAGHPQRAPAGLFVPAASEPATTRRSDPEPDECPRAGQPCQGFSSDTPPHHPLSGPPPVAGLPSFGPPQAGSPPAPTASAGTAPATSSLRSPPFCASTRTLAMRRASAGSSATITSPPRRRRLGSRPPRTCEGRLQGSAARPPVRS